MKIIIIAIAFLLFSVIGYPQDYNRELAMSDSLYELRQFNNALNHGLKAMETASKDEGNQSKPYANALNMIGAIYFSMNNYDKAIEFFYKERDAKKIAYGPTTKSYAKSLNNLGTVLAQVGRNREAEPIMREALKLKINSSGMNDTSVATSANVLGAICFQLGMLNEAERYFLLAGDVRKIILGVKSIPYSMTMFSLGSLYRTLGNYENAVRCLNIAYDNLKAQYGDDNNTTLNVMSELAMSYVSLGENGKSKELLEKIISIRQNVSGNNHTDYFNSSYNLAMYYWNGQQYDKAAKMLEETREAVEKNFGNGHPLYSKCMNALGLIYWQTGDLQKAYQYLATTVRLREQIFGRGNASYATSLHNLAAITKELGNHSEAEKKYHEALELYLYQIRNVFPFLSEVEKARFYADLHDRFDMFFLYALSRRKENPRLLADMLDYRLATKGILLDATRKIRNQIAESNNPALKLTFTQWKDTREKLSQYFSMNRKEQKASGINVQMLEESANKLEKELSNESRTFGESYNREALKWQDVQSALQNGEAAVEIIRLNNFNNKWTDTVIYAILITTKDTKEHPRLVLLSNGYDIEKYYIRNYLNSIRFQIDDNDSYGAFWEPIEKELDGIKKVYVSLDGVFNKINLNAILRPYHDYVIDHFNIVVVQNTTDIVKDASGKATDRTAYLLGNPKYGLTGEDEKKYRSADESYPVYSKVKFSDLSMFIPELPGTKTELENIDKQLETNRWKVTEFEQAEASETNFKQIRKAGVVHLATHGFFLNDISGHDKCNIFGVDIDKAAEDPMLRSGLLFSGATNALSSQGVASTDYENGILTAYEASALDFDDIDLLVLSACETGLGEIKNGEGVYGLQRAFVVAGAKKIIMSLWKVNDNTTQMLMSLFYSNWLGGNDIDEALRKAQLKVKEEWTNPYFWGGFITIGKN